MTSGRIPVVMNSNSIAFVRKIEEDAPVMIAMFDRLRETFGTKSNWLSVVFASNSDYLRKYKEHKFDLVSIMDRSTAYSFVGRERIEDYNKHRRYRVVDLTDSGKFSEIYEFERVEPIEQGEDA